MRRILLGMGVALVLLVLDWVALSPYLGERADLTSQRDKAATAMSGTPKPGPASIARLFSNPRQC